MNMKLKAVFGTALMYTPLLVVALGILANHYGVLANHYGVGDGWILYRCGWS